MLVSTAASGMPSFISSRGTIMVPMHFSSFTIRAGPGRPVRGSCPGREPVVTKGSEIIAGRPGTGSETSVGARNFFLYPATKEGSRVRILNSLKESHPERIPRATPLKIRLLKDRPVVALVSADRRQPAASPCAHQIRCQTQVYRHISVPCSRFYEHKSKSTG